MLCTVRCTADLLAPRVKSSDRQGGQKVGHTTSDHHHHHLRSTCCQNASDLSQFFKRSDYLTNSKPGYGSVFGCENRNRRRGRDEGAKPWEEAKPTTSSTQPSGAEENPLETGNTFPSCSVFLYMRNKDLRMMRTVSCFGILSHYKRTIPSITPKVPFTPGHHPGKSWDQGEPCVPQPPAWPSLPTARYLQAEDVLALPQGHGLPQHAGAVGRARRNAALLTRQGPWGKGVGGKEDIHYQREQLSAFSSRPSAARVCDQGCAMGGAAGQRGLLGAGWLPERPRSASLIAALTSPELGPAALSARRRRSESPARRHCAGAGAARAARPQRFPRSGSGRGRP